MCRDPDLPTIPGRSHRISMSATAAFYPHCCGYAAAAPGAGSRQARHARRNIHPPCQCPDPCVLADRARRRVRRLCCHHARTASAARSPHGGHPHSARSRWTRPVDPTGAAGRRKRLHVQPHRRISHYPATSSGWQGQHDCPEQRAIACPDRQYVRDRSRSRRVARLLAITEQGTAAITKIPGLPVGAVVLDGSRIAINVANDDGHCSVIVVDTRTGTSEDFLSVSQHSDDRVVGYVRDSNLLVAATNAAGESRLGIGYLDIAPLRFPSDLADVGPVTLLACSNDGRVVAVVVDIGAKVLHPPIRYRSHGVYGPVLPPLVVLGAGVIAAGRLIAPVSTADRPATLLRIDIMTGEWWFDDPPLDGVPTCRVTQLACPDGAIEAAVVGDPELADTVLIALHGGPLSAWRAMFDPMLAELAAHGIAVVAPNVRGSTGYGAAHSRAIQDNWGGPDLHDVIAVGASVRSQRAPNATLPGLLGISYGGYLAILAAAREPVGWSSCVALAPFVSGARVAAAPGPVAELARRLGGMSSPDLRHEVGNIEVPVLLVHGERDDVTGVSESLILHAAMTDRARNSTIHQIPGAGHDLIGGPHRTTVVDLITTFWANRRGDHVPTIQPAIERKEVRK